MKRILLILSCLTVMTVKAEETKYICYSGKIPFHKAIHDHIIEIKIALTKESHGASLIAYYDEAGNRYSNDLFCPKKYIGRCGILDDAGSLKIQKLSQSIMTIQFNGVPRLYVDAGGVATPMIDSNIKLKFPLRITLTARPEKECFQVKKANKQ